jgi:hypothetical protein
MHAELKKAKQSSATKADAPQKSQPWMAKSRVNPKGCEQEASNNCCCLGAARKKSDHH